MTRIMNAVAVSAALGDAYHVHPEDGDAAAMVSRDGGDLAYVDFKQMED